MNLLLGSVKVGKIFGVEVKIHNTLFIFFLLSVFSDGIVMASTLFPIIFGSVLFHEFAHVLQARKFGIHCHGVVLSPIGGVAMLEMPRIPKGEFLIAFIGPVSSFFLAFMSLLFIKLLMFFGISLDAENPHLLLTISLVSFKINLMLAVFNLLPIFPMDGGRMFRAALQIKFSFYRSTEIAVYFSKIAVFAFIFLGIYTINPLLIFMAMFLFLCANQELRNVRGY